MPDKIPYFVGRQEECGAVLNHLTNGDTRLVGIWGPPGFGKTSLAINVAHHLRGLNIPVYFTSLRGMKSKDELVSKLLSIFTDAKQASNVSPSHWLIQCLQQLEKTFVLILDNADDLLESGDSMLKDDFLRFTQEILAQCSHIKLLFTTRESLDYLRHKLHIHQERVGVLDEVSSVSLVQQSLVKPVSDNDCSHVVNVCGRVPLAMRLMCGIMKEENVSLSELLDELKVSPLVEVLDDESFPDDARLKIIINRSFERLPGRERDAFVSLAVFPSSFEMQEAKAVLDLKTPRLTKKVIDSLKRKSLIDCSDDFKSCTIHSLLRSFIDERRTANHAVQTIFSEAQLRFYDYHISSFGVANENFLTGHSNDAFLVFVRQRESILISLENGAKEDALYPKVVKVLSKAELFFYALLPSEELLVEKLYRTTVGEAKKRQRRDDACKLLAAKSFRCLGGFYVDRQDLDQSLQAGILDTDRYTAKRLCYLGVHQLLCGRTDDGTSSLRASVDRLSSDCDEKVLKILACHVLAICYRKKGDTKNASDFQTFCSNECKSASFSPAVLNLFSRDISSADKVTDCDSIIEQDVFFFVVVAELLPILYRELEFDKETETERSIMINHLVGLHKDLSLFHKGIVRVCCNALFSLRCFKEAAEGFQVMITNELEKTRGSELRCTAQNYLVRGLALKEMKDYKGASLCLKKSLDIRMQLLQESRDVNQGVKMVADVIDSLIECLQMQKHFDGATTGHTYDFKVICEELTSVLKKSMEKIHNVDHDAIAKNCNKLGRCYIRMDDYNAALESFEQAIKIREEHVGDSNEKVSCLSNKGTAYFIMNRKRKAYEAYQSALDLRKRLGIEDHADTAPIYEAIGVNHFESEEFSESLDAFRQCLKLRKKHLGNHTLTAHSFTVTGYVYLTREEYNAARENFQHAANLAKSLLGDHEVTASQFELLATAYLKMGNYRGALDAYQESRNIRVKLLSEHRDTAMSFQLADNNRFEIGNFENHVYKTHDNKIFAEIIDSIWNCLKTPNNLDSASTGDSDDFKALLEELKSVLQSMEQINDVEHAELARNYNQLGCCFFLMDDKNAALESFEQAIKIREEHLADSVNKVSCLVNKGHVYSKMNQTVEAGKAYQSVLDLRKLLEIEDHADTATIYDLLGENYFVLEKFDEALEAFRQSLLLRKKHLGCHTLTAQTHAAKAAMHFEMGKYECAVKHFQHAADMLKSLLGDQEETASMFQCLANTYVETENYRGALDALQELKNIRLKLSGEHLDTAMSFEQVGNVCLMMDDFEEAIRSFRKASELKLSLLGDHLDTAQSYQLLGTAQLGNGDFSDAVESLKTALRIKLKAPGCHPETEETLKLLRYASQSAASFGSTQPSLSTD